MWRCSKRGPDWVEPNSGMTGANRGSSCWSDSPSQRQIPPQHSSTRSWASMWEAARLSAVATLDNRAQFYSGKESRNKADHYARLQKRLQRKGTRSATRRSIALGQRERRLKLNTNHTMSKRILATHPEAFIGLEE